MGLFDLLFGKKQKPTKSVAAKNLKISIAGDILTVDAIDFFGLFSKSKSGKWIIAWRDSDPSQHRGGYRESGLGEYVLLNVSANRIAAHGKMERPNGGKVADNGTFSLEDWKFGGGLKGTFYVFSAEGAQLVSKSVAANIYSSAISDDGKFAVFQTANAPEPDGNKFFAFDIEDQAELFGIHPPTGWADKYEFSDNPSCIVISQKGVGKFKYDLNGNFIDQKKYDAARLNSKRFEVALPAAADLLKGENISREIAEKVLQIIFSARSAGADEQKSWKAMALKLQGIAYEAIGDAENALVAFEEAQAINPKIGVKQKIKSLKK